MKKFLVSMLTFCLTVVILAQSAIAAVEVGRVNTAVRFRNEPKDSSSYGFSVYEGYEVRVHSESNGWYKVEFNGKTGYIKTKYVDVSNKLNNSAVQNSQAANTGSSQSKPASGTGYVKVAVRFRDEPKEDANSVFTLYPGTQVQVLSTADGWCKVEFNGATGYIKPEYLDIKTAELQTAAETQKAPETPAPAPSKLTSGMGIVNVAVRFRDEPTEDAKSAFTLYPGAEVIVVSTADGWCAVNYNGATGYIRPDYLNIRAAEIPALPSSSSYSPPPVETEFRGTGTIKVAVRFRNEPKEDATSAQTLYPGYNCLVLSKQGEWAICEYAGRRGYVKADYIALTTEAISPLTEPGALTGRAKVNKDGIYLRLGPAYNYGVVRLLNLDEDVSVYEMQGNWYRVIAAGDGGYVHKDALNIAGVRKNASTARNAVSQGYVESSSIGQTIVDEARKHLGIKYVYSQESPAMGFDCSGFAWYVFRQCGIDIQRTAQGIFDNDGTSVGYDQLQVGDLVFLGSSESNVNHVGIYIGNGEYIHSSSTKGKVVISNLDNSKIYIGARRVFG